uniref:Uncharacterized protein n=1 Tax=Arundo donax TaxID=35708 RepID=A0A0A8XRY6_ARUDO
MCSCRSKFNWTIFRVMFVLVIFIQDKKGVCGLPHCTYTMRLQT